jgi:hypothetical protein
MKKNPTQESFFLKSFWLPELSLKTSNTHNFLSVGPKNTKFVLPRSLLRGASSQKVSKEPKIYCIHSSLPKNTKAILASLVL